MVAVPRLTTRLNMIDCFPLGPGVWQDTVLELTGVPDCTKLLNVFTGARISASSPSEGTVVIQAGDLFADFPVALLLNECSD